MIPTLGGGAVCTAWAALLLLGMGACRSPEPPSRKGNVTIYGRDSVGPSGTHMGDSLETPATLAPLQIEIEQFSRSPDMAMKNRTAHRNLVSEVIEAMSADFRRLGRTDPPGFKELSDSILEELGGGTGPAKALDSEEVPAHLERLERLVALYNQVVRDTSASLGGGGAPTRPH